MELSPYDNTLPLILIIIVILFAGMIMGLVLWQASEERDDMQYCLDKGFTDVEYKSIRESILRPQGYCVKWEDGTKIIKEIK